MIFFFYDTCIARISVLVNKHAREVSIFSWIESKHTSQNVKLYPCGCIHTKQQVLSESEI